MSLVRGAIKLTWEQNFKGWKGGGGHGDDHHHVYVSHSLAQCAYS